VRVDEFDFDLPEERIALRPARPRDSARMLVVDPAGDAPLRDLGIADLPDLLMPGDALVFNDTRVIPAQLEGVRHRGEAMANVSVTLLKPIDGSRWQVLARPAKRLRIGDRIVFGERGNVCYLSTLWADIESRDEEGRGLVLSFDFHGSMLDEAIDMLGKMPLPPYIASRRETDEADVADYQTIYAREAGAVAAPTAGLHFTPELLATLDAKGVARHFVTLHVGAGTFLQVKVEDTRDHEMHSEWGEVSAAVAGALNKVHEAGKRVIAVGSTSLRLLEAAADEAGHIHPFNGQTDIFIAPGYRFRAVDAMVTNFHLPRSTLFMLVSAFSGLDTMKKAYTHAIEKAYRFYSYGDTCFLNPSRDMA
jgi:S-adenosylmethionine:tRNA ribosyltransferase-isomerase